MKHHSRISSIVHFKDNSQRVARLSPFFFTKRLCYAAVFVLASLFSGGQALAFQHDFTEFKEKQMSYPNVRTAYLDKARVLETELEAHNVYTLGNCLFIRVFKQEKLMEVWFRPLAASQYKLLKTYTLCSNSGDVGPKQTLADQKIPEGFYTINRFAPSDPHFLALGINYPNGVDRYRSAQAANVEIRGGCKSSGSMPLEDEYMKELYVLATEAYAVGQARIPVHIFPTKMQGERFEELMRAYQDNAERKRFWNNIKTGYDYFNLTHRLPNVETGTSGLYLFRDGSVEVVGSDAPILVGSLNETEIPTTTTPPPTTTPAPVVTVPDGIYHTVKPGETLYGLSKLYRHSIYLLKKWNSIQGNIISVGQQIRVVPPDYYVVKAGDTLYGIAKQYGLQVAQLKAMNNKRNDIVRIGEKLIVVPE